MQTHLPRLLPVAMSSTRPGCLLAHEKLRVDLQQAVPSPACMRGYGRVGHLRHLLQQVAQQLGQRGISARRGRRCCPGQGNLGQAAHEERADAPLRVLGELRDGAHRLQVAERLLQRCQGLL